MMSRAAVLIGLVLAGCATSPLAVRTAQDIEGLAGSWRGWIVTEPEFTPATLQIHRDGTVEMSGWWMGMPRTMTGLLAVRDGTFRLEGSGGWWGIVTVSGATDRRTLKIERDDRLFPARFTLASPTQGH